MDREHFDALTRLFAANPTRRAALGALLAAGLAGASGRAEAKPNVRNRTKRKTHTKRKQQSPVALSAEAADCRNRGAISATVPTISGEAARWPAEEQRRMDRHQLDSFGRFAWDPAVAADRAGHPAWATPPRYAFNPVDVRPRRHAPRRLVEGTLPCPIF